MQRNPFLLLAAFVLMVISTFEAQPPSTPMSTQPDCQVEQLSLRTDNRNGDFNGMSHSGVQLLLLNKGTIACRVQAIPALIFADSEHDLHVKAQPLMPKFVHPGPVMVPLVIPPGAEATSTIRWVSSPVYDNSTCIDPTKISITIGGKALSSSFQGHLCGEHTKGIFYQASRLTLMQAAKQ